MDFQILIIIACVFLASLFSLLFINKFFRRKTFEEIVAEKKAMTEKIYGPAKAAKKQARSVKVPSKKELKKEKRQRQQKKSEDNTTEVDDSDAQSENPSIEDVPEEPQQQQQVVSKKAVQPVVHVEFAAPEAEIVDSDNGSNVGQRRSSADSNNQKTTNKSNKQRKNANTKSAGILANKNENVVVKEISITTEEKPALNNFESKPPKDAVELKKQEAIDNKKPKDQRKTNKPKKETPLESVVGAVEILSVSKDLKQMEDKPVRTGSPKSQSNKLKQQNKKKNDKDNIALDKINENDTIGVNLLMNLFGRAELNRSEIQILIDYLLNKQQDMPASHSEWSDDIVQKLKKQLEEREKALQEEQESSIGIQAKLREMRTEINTERAQMNATVKGYMEEIQAKKSEIAAMTQEIQNLNDKFTLERQQFQNKLRVEKQASSQEVLVQLQRENERATMLQAELAHKEQAFSELNAIIAQKDQCINDMKCLVNASHQGVEDAKQKTNEIIKTQVNQIQVLEQKLDEAEVVINKQRYELEKAKTIEAELEATKVELRNLQNALDSKQSELDMALNELGDKREEMDTLQLQNKELSEEIGGINNKAEEKNKQQNDLKNTLDILQTALEEKDKKLLEYETSVKQLTSKEDELIKQIQEQKEKNNQQQQQHNALLLSHEQQQKAVTIKSDPAGNEKQIRDILERLYPDAVAVNAGSALSLSFDQWVEQVLATHVKQSISKNSATTATSTTSTNTTNIPATNSNSSSNHSSHNHNNLNSSEDTKNISDSIINSSSVSTSTSSGSSDVESTLSAADKAEILKLQSQNAQLRANSEELTKLVTKTGNTLLELEARAREQEENWRSIVRSKEEEINLLKHSNGEKQDI